MSAIIKLLSPAADAVLSVKNLFNVTKEVTNWYTLGLQLDIPTHKLQSIQHDHRTLENSKHEMLHFWVHSDPEASWGKLATAVERMEFRRISERIRDNYIPLSQRSVAMAASTRGILLVNLAIPGSVMSLLASVAAWMRTDHIQTMQTNAIGKLAKFRTL